VIVRPADAAELPALAAAVAPQPLLQRYGVTAEGLARDLAAALARGEPVLVADDGGAIGFAWFTHQGTFAAGGYLKLIALVPARVGGGAGSLLLAAVENAVRARSSRHLFLLVSHWNDGARRFYARHGYREVGTLPAFVRADTDEVICWKRLTP
jgi:GNAT superfamily N-acetyltransferase